MFQIRSSDTTITKRINLEFAPLLLFSITALVVTSTYLMLFRNAFHGIDISDEGMYLLSVHNVSERMAFHNPFGDYTGLLYRLSSQKLWLFRLEGFVVLGAVGAYLGDAIGKFLPEKSPRIANWTIALSGLLIGPFYYSIGILSPSYNWLNLVSLCLGVGAIIHLQHFRLANKSAFSLHLVLLSLAIWIGTFAKLSTGLGIFLVFLTASALLRPPIREFVQQIGAQFIILLSLAAVHHVFISPLGYVIEKITRGQRALTILDPQYSISHAFNSFKGGSVDWLFTLAGVGTVLPLLFLFLLFSVIRFYKVFENHYERYLKTLLLLPIISGVFSWRGEHWTGVSARYNDQMWSVTHILSLSIFSVLLVSCLEQKLSFSTFLWFGALLGVPVLYAFGSNNGFIMQITGATGVIALGAIFLLTTSQRTSGSLLAVTCLVFSLGALSTTLSSSRTPYRQSPLSQQSVRIEITPGSGRLYVEKNFADEIKLLRTQLKSNGWKSRTALLDFTQYSAGIVYALDAKQPITVIPTVGGMGGVNALMAWSLSYIADHDEEKIWHSAWLLIPSEPNLNVCSLCPDISALSHLGRSFPGDYELVAKSKNYRIYKPLD